jgi:hypothetical protein
MARVSRLWRFGEASADDENNVARAIADVNEAVSLDPPEPESGTPKALLITIDPEQHWGGLWLLATALRDDGWNPVVVGGIQRGNLIDMVTRGGFSVVMVSSTYVSPLSERTLVAAVEAVKALGKAVIAGGQAFERNPALADVVRATAVAHDPRSAMVMARRFRDRDRRNARRRRLSAAV